MAELCCHHHHHIVGDRIGIALRYVTIDSVSHSSHSIIHFSASIVENVTFFLLVACSGVYGYVESCQWAVCGVGHVMW